LYCFPRLTATCAVGSNEQASSLKLSKIQCTLDQDLPRDQILAIDELVVSAELSARTRTGSGYDTCSL